MRDLYLAQSHGARFIMQSIALDNFSPYSLLGPRPAKRRSNKGVDDMRAQFVAIRVVFAGSCLAAACTTNRVVPATDSHAAADHAMPSASAANLSMVDDRTRPPDGAGALARLASSPRHGEWAMIRTGDGDSIRAWVVYPERSSKAPVVLVVHEIFGLSSWIRSVADQLAADGFIAIAPDLLTMKNLPDGPDSVVAPLARAVIGTLDPAWVHKQLAAVARRRTAVAAARRRPPCSHSCVLLPL